MNAVNIAMILFSLAPIWNIKTYDSFSCFQLTLYRIYSGYSAGLAQTAFQKAHKALTEALASPHGCCVCINSSNMLITQIFMISMQCNLMAAYQQYLYTMPYILLFVNKCNKKVIVIFYDYVRRDLYCANLIKSTIRQKLYRFD